MKRTAIALKMLWLLVCVSVLSVTLYHFDGKPNSDVDDFQIHSMLALSFPISYLVAGLYAVSLSLVDRFYAVQIPTSYLELSITWLGFTVAGFVQWFKLLPWCISRVRDRKNKRELISS
jgi:hypothetical protein